MATEKKPAKGILKNSTSFDKAEPSNSGRPGSKRDMKWDEMNIIATYHPADKDYGHMKIDEPPTPYAREEGEEEEEDDLDPVALAARLESGAKAKVLQEEESSEEEPETEDQKVRRKSFENKRKSHYNEFQAVKLARQLMQDEDEEDEDGESKQEQEKSSPQQ